MDGHLLWLCSLDLHHLVIHCGSQRQQSLSNSDKKALKNRVSDELAAVTIEIFHNTTQIIIRNNDNNDMPFIIFFKITELKSDQSWFFFKFLNVEDCYAASAALTVLLLVHIFYSCFTRVEHSTLRQHGSVIYYRRSLFCLVSSEVVKCNHLNIYFCQV